MFATLATASALPVLPNMTIHVLDVQMVSISGNNMVLFVASFALKAIIVLKLDNLSMLPTAITLHLEWIIRPIVNV